MADVIIAVPDDEPIRRGYSGLVSRANDVVVRDATTHGMAQTMLKDLALAERGVREKLDPIIKNANTAHKQLTSLRAELLTPISKAKGVINGVLYTYEEAERKRAEAEAAELARQEKAQQEEEILAAAAAAEEAGDKAEAEEILNTPVEKPLVTVDTETAKVKGVHSRETWSATVVDLKKLVKYVAENPAYIGLLQTNQAAVNSMARAQKENLNLPGVRAQKKVSRSVRAG